MVHTFDVDKVLSELSLPDKVKLLTGDGLWHTVSFPENGVPAVRMTDGPNGARGIQFFNSSPSNCFPCSTGLASSFDVELAKEVGERLGDECRAKNAHILLGPTVNTQRSPLGGRGFESFSEDPHVNGTIAGAYIQGLQSKGVAATIKHFATNDQEFQRFSISSEVSERALREIYLKPFQIALKAGNPWALMTAYNRINGLHCSENEWLLQDVLRKEWGWKGLIMSDWSGTYSTSASIKAGLDLEMPGPSVVRGAAAHRALVAEKLFPEDIDARARKVLETANRAIESGIPFNAPEGTLDSADTRAFLRKAAANAVVLLKNEQSILPLKQGLQRIAVIGPNAKYAVISGGGSAALRPAYTVSPLEGISAAAKKAGAEVVYAAGVNVHQYLPLADKLIATEGALFEFWNESPAVDFLDPAADVLKPLPSPVWSTRTSGTNCFLADGLDESKLERVCWFKYTTTFTADEDGDWELDLSIGGHGNMYVDGKLFISLTNFASTENPFFLLGSPDVRKVLTGLKAGEPHKIEIRIANSQLVASEPIFKYRGGIRLGAIRKVEDEEAIKDAVEKAKTADVAILVIGLNNDWESEHHDRDNMELPGLTNKLVSEVIKANPKTVVVNQSGTPVEMPWVGEAHTLLQAFYGGNEVGNGIAYVLFGVINPSSKLPLTFPQRLEDSPSWPGYGARTDVPGKVLYNEGIFVGYRGYEIKSVKPLFPFGYGLSYTSFEYSDIAIAPISADGEFTVSCTVKNVGAVDGSEVVQVYVAQPGASLPRPIKELKGFTKAFVKAGESARVSVALDRHALSYYNERRGAWVAEASEASSDVKDYTVLVASSSADVRLTGKVKLSTSLVWHGL